MPGEIINLNDFSNEISNKLANLVIKDKIKIKIVSIIIGDDPSSMSYLNGMKKRGVKLGIEVQIISYPLNVSEVTVLNDINILNNDISCAGIILQMPLPVNLDSRKITCWDK